MKPVVFALFPLILFPLRGVAQQNNLTNSYSEITPEERVRWVIDTAIDPAGLAGHAFSAGFGTWINSPKELGVQDGI
jgi:ATP/ADP translocase